jgi:hypothetical protein
MGTVAGSNFIPEKVIVRAPESVAAGWKQCEQEPIAALPATSKLKNFTLFTWKNSFLGVIIP